MEFLDKLSEKITSKGREVSDKAKDLAELASLKGRISSCEDVIRKNYIEIGRIYYEQHAAEPEEAYEEACRAVTDAKNGIADLEQKIRDVKGI